MPTDSKAAAASPTADQFGGVDYTDALLLIWAVVSLQHLWQKWQKPRVRRCDSQTLERDVCAGQIRKVAPLCLFSRTQIDMLDGTFHVLIGKTRITRTFGKDSVACSALMNRKRELRGIWQLPYWFWVGESEGVHVYSSEPQPGGAC